MQEHPSVELLRQYEEGALPEHINHQLESHMLNCDLCTDIVDGMVLADRTQSRAAANSVGQRLKNRLRKQKKKRNILHGLSDWRVAAAILMMFFSLALLVYYQYVRSSSSQKTAAKTEQNTNNLTTSTAFVSLPQGATYYTKEGTTIVATGKLSYRDQVQVIGYTSAIGQQPDAALANGKWAVVKIKSNTGTQQEQQSADLFYILSKHLTHQGSE
ncbi:hypothetical protein [Pontibacter rugosus]|uniref:Zinc-finger domain-containing protein n=1 Tax=Pontibacter rugosus TaxID=1745966 RepID=A0ABW3SY41_9BACT